MPRYAYLLAVEEYLDPRLSVTPYCHSDAKLLRDALTNDLDYDAQNVLVQLLGKEDRVTPQAVLSELEGLLKRSGARDTVLFYFAGHGTLSGGTGFLVLPRSNPDDYEGSALSLDAVDSILRRDQRLCVRVFDACHSGVEPMKTRSGFVLDTAGFAVELDREPARGWVTFASCDVDQKSYWDDAEKHGAYTAAFCGAIGGSPEGQAVSVLDLQQDVIVRMEQWTTDHGEVQTPMLMGVIAGAQTIGVRSKKVAKADTPKAKELDVGERVVEVRKIEQPKAEYLAILGEKLGEAYGNCGAKLLSFGATVGPIQFSPITKLYDALEQAIVKEVTSRQLRPPFECESKWVQRQQPRGLVGSLLDDYARREGYQRYDFSPKEGQAIYGETTISEVWPIPKATVFSLAFLLQTKIYVVSGSTIGDDELIGVRTGLELSCYEIVDTCDVKIWEPTQHLAQTIEKFNQRFAAVAKDVTAYLEREQAAK